MLEVSPSGYFAWKSRPASRRQREDLVLLAHVRSAFALSNMTYGSPRMTHELRGQGLETGRRRVARLMRENGLRARQPRRFRRTTDSLHAFPVAPNLLDQDFAAERPDEKWGADISYVWTREGWLYLAVVMDLFARRVVGWAVSDRLHKELALAALRRALVVRRPGADLIHHSDRGSQYCSIEYQAELRKHGVLISMSGKGNCFDNAMVETFFKTLKSELVWRTAFQTRAEARDALARYIDGFYNPTRRHSAASALHSNRRGWCRPQDAPPTTPPQSGQARQPRPEPLNRKQPHGIVSRLCLRPEARIKVSKRSEPGKAGKPRSGAICLGSLAERCSGRCLCDTRDVSLGRHHRAAAMGHGRAAYLKVAAAKQTSRLSFSSTGTPCARPRRSGHPAARGRTRGRS